MLSCEICEIFKNTYFEEHLQTTASKHKTSFLEVFCRSCCSTLINAMMKYRDTQVFFKGIFQYITGIFERISPQVQSSDIKKCILMAASEVEFILETFLHGCFSRAVANAYI